MFLWKRMDKMPNQKKLIEGIEKILCPNNRGDHCQDHRNCIAIATAIAKYLEKNYEIKTKTPTNE